MSDLNNRELAQQFIQTQMFAVVSSIWHGAPQSATVAFTELGDFSIIFGTQNLTRKYRNLKSNALASVVIGWDEAITIQIEGEATLLLDEHEKDMCRKKHVLRHPGSAKYAFEPEQAYFKITPRWLRYTDISKEPEFSFEIEF